MKVKISTEMTIAKVEVNGETIVDATGYTISHKAGELPSVKIDRIPSAVIFDGHAEVDAIGGTIEVRYDPIRDVLFLDGVGYHAELFRHFGTKSPKAFKGGEVYQFLDRNHEAFSFRTFRGKSGAAELRLIADLMEEREEREQELAPAATVDAPGVDPMELTRAICR